MSDGGGSGISTIVVLQSLAQARAVWGENQASAIWDAAIVKAILGGGSNARDLEDLSKLHRQRDERSHLQQPRPRRPPLHLDHHDARSRSSNPPPCGRCRSAPRSCCCGPPPRSP